MPELIRRLNEGKKKNLFCLFTQEKHAKKKRENKNVKSLI